MNHANSILETFEYLCQITSKSIVTISSYTVSKMGRFFETQCIYFTVTLSLNNITLPAN